ncbi:MULTISPECIES: aromatic ring-hydroxylating oxygenase subunit alpha [unclassified Mycobacterium]|uniref:aromatic ring-hydroxylating oxygenase subunit alpha n=1 Tax=unclassified Mycobacterium TaxID=2642494 RepID=UPI0029C95DC2|nr:MULTISPECIES: Rieske 2Fe-2S domain-containing protein [unclassified Mycobacterium]
MALTEQLLRGAVGPVLSDGTAVVDLVDLERREVSRRVYSDPEIFRLELDRVFARSWVFLAHESELANPGDYVLRYLGQDQVIVNRSSDGQVNVLLNACAHRGMALCFADKGAATQFKCRFHGWLYDDHGRLRAAPYERDMYGADWDKSAFGMRSARVAIYQGLIFATFAADAVSFEQYLGDEGRWYYDSMFGNKELRTLGPPLRLPVRANWKIFGEQSNGDAYHVPTQHVALSELGFMSTPPSDAKGWGLLATGVITNEDHVFVFDDYRERFAGVSLPPEEQQRLGPGWIMSAMMFPGNFTIISPHPNFEGGLNSLIAVNQFIPKDVDTFEVWTLALVDASMSDEEVAEISESTHVSLAMSQPDDIDAWEWIQRGSRGAVGRRETIKYNTMAEPRRPDGWEGPGRVYSGFLKDNANWHFWLRWLDAMAKPGSLDI